MDTPCQYTLLTPELTEDDRRKVVDTLKGKGYIIDTPYQHITSMQTL